MEVNLSAGDKSGMIGKILAEYRIVEELGGQAGSQIFKANGFDGRRPVAITLFPSALSQDKARLQGLLDSLRKIARLNQPGIPRLIGSGLNGGRAYIIMPFMTGGSLQERLEIGRSSPTDALALLGKIADVLEKTHELGIVHGHLTPAEVMFDDTGQLQIIGLGQEPFVSDARCMSAVADGHEHIAPEVRDGGQPTPASDQYSMAVLAFELLTGQRVNKALEAATLTGSNGRASASTSIHLAPEVIGVLQRALEVDPSRRFADVAQMVRALRQAVRAGGLASQASPGSAGGRRAAPRIGRTLALGVVSVAIVALGCFGLTVPTMAAARWMRLDLASIANLFSIREIGRAAATATGQPPTGLPEPSPALPASTSIERPQAFLPTSGVMGGTVGSTQVGSPADDPTDADPAEPELAPDDAQATHQTAGEAPQAGSASSSQDQVTPTPTRATWPTPNPSDSQQSSPTPAPAQPTATNSGGCSIPSKQGCNGSIPSP